MTIYEATKKLLGSIKPYGETNTDKRRLDNLEEHIKITDSLVRDLIASSKYRERQEYSMKKIGDKAYEELLNLKDIIEMELERGNLNG